MSTLALVWGIVTFVGFVLGLIPCLGILNWLNIPLAVIGVILGVIALAQGSKEGPGAAIGGIVLCLVAVLGGAVRLFVGGGLL